MIAGLYVLVQGVSLWLDRYLLMVQNDDRITGPAYTSANAVIPDSPCANTWNSTTPVSYRYYSHTYTGYAGNYWGDYAGADDGVPLPQN